jgi:hypothetical protein
LPSRYLVAEIPTGNLGLNGSNNEAQLPPGTLVAANSISFAEGGFVKEGGSAKFNTTAVTGSPDIVGGHDWFPIEGSQRVIIATNDGRILRATTSGSATGVFSNIATGLTSPQSTVFVAAGSEALGQNRKLFLFNGGNSPRYIDGDAVTLATMANPAADWSDTVTGAPTFGANHLGRLWVGGNANDPHRIYYSTASSHVVYTTTGAGSFPIYPGEGQKLVGAISFKGHLFCWKFPRGVYYIDSTDASIANWRVDRLSDTIGMAGPHAFAIVDSDIVFLDASGQFQSVSNLDQTTRTTANISNVAEMGQWVRDNLDLSKLSQARMVFYANRREIHCAVTGIGSQENNLRIILDYNSPNGVRFRTSDKDTAVAMWMKQDSNSIDRPTIGDDAGFVWNIDQATKSKDGVGYEGLARTPYMDLSFLDPSLGTVNKNFQWLEMVVNPTGNFDVNATIYIDGTATETVTFNMGTTGAALGSFTLDTDQLGGGTVLNRKRRIHGFGRRIAIEVKNSGAAEDFNISRMYLHFTPGNTRI